LRIASLVLILDEPVIAESISDRSK